MTKNHDRKSFDCGDSELNTFLQRHARQSHEKGGSKTFLAIGETNQAILGFYSLAPASLSYERTPLVACKGHARYDVPGFRLARLATNLNVQGLGLGGQLLLSAGHRCLRAATEIGGSILIIDAKNVRAASWYISYGALALEDAPLTLVLPLQTIETALREAGKL